MVFMRTVAPYWAASPSVGSSGPMPRLRADERLGLVTLIKGQRTTAPTRSSQRTKLDGLFAGSLLGRESSAVKPVSPERWHPRRLDVVAVKRGNTKLAPSYPAHDPVAYMAVGQHCRPGPAGDRPSDGPHAGPTVSGLI